ncbi:zwei Ig domain protein zig-8-like [Macrobrachium nipponense]|uniref:zwei Ig domain protein zig-8-like n=1 Tax=Macrobrachium nipponense TaxID=159736 RepID=UPI0030C7E327
MDHHHSAFSLLLLLCVTSITDGDEGLSLKDMEKSTSSSFMSDASLLDAFQPGIAITHRWRLPDRYRQRSQYIDPATPLHVTAYSGVPALIRCLVNNLGQRSVSWIRHQDIHVLTVGRFAFTNDDRFDVQHDDGSNEWVLKLRSPTVNDSGTYECQINTKPTISQLISLTVLEPKAVITAGKELYINRESTLRLTCKVTNAPSASAYLLWYHEEKVANYEMEKVQVSVENVNETTISTLTLEDAQPTNSGTYTCNPSNARPASVRVHVLSGEHPAAMQTNGASFCLTCDSRFRKTGPSIAMPTFLSQLDTQKLALSLSVCACALLLHSVLENSRPSPVDVSLTHLAAGGLFLICWSLAR